MMHGTKLSQECLSRRGAFSTSAKSDTCFFFFLDLRYLDRRYFCNFLLSDIFGYLEMGTKECDVGGLVGPLKALVMNKISQQPLAKLP